MGGIGAGDAVAAFGYAIQQTSSGSRSASSIDVAQVAVAVATIRTCTQNMQAQFGEYGWLFDDVG